MYRQKSNSQIFKQIKSITQPLKNEEQTKSITQPLNNEESKNYQPQLNKEEIKSISAQQYQKTIFTSQLTDEEKRQSFKEKDSTQNQPQLVKEERLQSQQTNVNMNDITVVNNSHLLENDFQSKQREGKQIENENEYYCDYLGCSNLLKGFACFFGSVCLFLYSLVYFICCCCCCKKKSKERFLFQYLKDIDILARIERISNLSFSCVEPIFKQITTNIFIIDFIIYMIASIIQVHLYPLYVLYIWIQNFKKLFLLLIKQNNFLRRLSLIILIEISLTLVFLMQQLPLFFFYFCVLQRIYILEKENYEVICLFTITYLIYITIYYSLRLKTQIYIKYFEQKKVEQYISQLGLTEEDDKFEFLNKSQIQIYQENINGIERVQHYDDFSVNNLYQYLSKIDSQFIQQLKDIKISYDKKINQSLTLNIQRKIMEFIFLNTWLSIQIFFK